jgi:hypothetical protein
MSDRSARRCADVLNDGGLAGYLSPLSRTEGMVKDRELC